MGELTIISTIIGLTLALIFAILIHALRKNIEKKRRREQKRQEIQKRMFILAQLEEETRSEKENQQMKETTATLDAGFSQENEFSLLDLVFMTGFGRKNVEVDTNETDNGAIIVSAASDSSTNSSCGSKF